MSSIVLRPALQHSSGWVYVKDLFQPNPPVQYDVNVIKTLPLISGLLYITYEESEALPKNLHVNDFYILGEAWVRHGLFEFEHAVRNIVTAFDDFKKAANHKLINTWLSNPHSTLVLNTPHNGLRKECVLEAASGNMTTLQLMGKMDYEDDSSAGLLDRIFSNSISPATPPMLLMRSHTFDTLFQIPHWVAMFIPNIMEMLTLANDSTDFVEHITSALKHTQRLDWVEYRHRSTPIDNQPRLKFAADVVRRFETEDMPESEIRDLFAVLRLLRVGVVLTNLSVSLMHPRTAANITKAGY